MASMPQSCTYLSSQTKEKILSVSCNGPKKNRIGRGQATARNLGRPPGYRFPKLHSPIENFIVPLKNKNELPLLS